MSTCYASECVSVLTLVMGIAEFKHFFCKDWISVDYYLLLIHNDYFTYLQFRLPVCSLYNVHIIASQRVYFIIALNSFTLLCAIFSLSSLGIWLTMNSTNMSFILGVANNIYSYNLNLVSAEAKMETSVSLR